MPRTQFLAMSLAFSFSDLISSLDSTWWLLGIPISALRVVNWLQPWPHPILRLHHLGKGRSLESCYKSLRIHFFFFKTNLGFLISASPCQSLPRTGLMTYLKENQVNVGRKSCSMNAGTSQTMFTAATNHQPTL